MKPTSPQYLSDRIQEALQGIDKLCVWLQQNRQSAPRLDMEADRLMLQLRRIHHRAAGWHAGAAEAPAIGFFGRSQAGKTSLISALAAGDNGRLEVALGGEIIDFATNINPDHQSAGMAIRFSRRRVTESPDFPVRLSLLAEADIIKIMALACRLHPSQGENRPVPEDGAIDDRLRMLSLHRLSEPVAGISGDEAIALWDFLARHDRQCQQRLAVRFWPAAIELCPYLAIDDRARLFSLLWADIPELTAAYSRLAHALAPLAGAGQVLAPRSLLVEDSRLPADALLDAMAFATLNTPADPDIRVRPLLENGAAAPVTLSLAELSLLTAELLIPLESSPREKVFEQVDIVDFPGYGGALNPGTADDLGQPPGTGPLRPFADAILRAKSLYLLERYAHRQQNHLLLICTAAGARSDAKIVGRTLEYWVKQTQGENAQLRDRRKPGLIWALSEFDQRITQGLNCDEAVQRYVGKPGDSWGTVLALDERGIKRMAAHLAEEIRGEVRLERITECLSELRRELLDNLLASWYRPAGSQDAAAKERIAGLLLKTLQTRAGVHGELLEQLLPSKGVLYRLYLQQRYLGDSVDRSNDGGEMVPADGTGPYGVGIEIDLLSDTPFADDPHDPAKTPGGGPAVNAGYEAEYARGVYRYWINHLRSLPENDALIALLGMDKSIVERLVEEFIIASVRLDIPGTLFGRLQETESADLPPESKADRQVTKALTVLGDFIAWLGFPQIDEARRPDSRINRGQKIFARPEKQAVSWDASRRLTKLAPTPANTTAFYIFDWLVGLKEMIIQNAGFSSGGGLSAEQQTQLGRILDPIQSAHGGD